MRDEARGSFSWDTILPDDRDDQSILLDDLYFVNLDARDYFCSDPSFFSNLRSDIMSEITCRIFSRTTHRLFDKNSVLMYLSELLVSISTDASKYWTGPCSVAIHYRIDPAFRRERVEFELDACVAIFTIALCLSPRQDIDPTDVSE